MYIARILYPVEVLGPGKRIGIWFDGCKHGCVGCSNPELWEFNEKYNVDISLVISLIKRIASENEVDGFTITGGDPFYQPEDLSMLLNIIHDISDDILIYTGFQYDEIYPKYANIISLASVIIDGPYIESRNNNCPLRGSDNQNIIIGNDKYINKYNDYLKTYNNKIQNFITKDGIVSVGIHKPGYNTKIKEVLKKEGVDFDE